MHIVVGPGGGWGQLVVDGWQCGIQGGPVNSEWGPGGGWGQLGDVGEHLGVQGGLVHAVVGPGGRWV